MATKELVALLGNSIVGQVRRDSRGRLTFAYEPAWSSAQGAYPISLSLPLVVRVHGHHPIDSYLWGLLPDNEFILDRWARRFQVSARNVFAIMEHVGEDCPGAVQFTRAERAHAIAEVRSKVDWLDTHQVAERLRALRVDASAWRQSDDAGQFSLAGAQAKTALLFDGRRWGVPSGRTPTTHILKPGMSELDGHVENEHFCLVLAREVGLPVAHSRVEHFEEQVAVVVERFDRLVTTKGVVRVHQEDVCQALAVHPSKKYQSEGGPGPRDIVELLRTNSRSSDEDVGVFVDSLIFNWIVGGTDAHAKNYAFLIGAEGRIRLAPLYDVASILPYAGKQLPKAKLAMKIGGKYRLSEIGPYEWDKLARELKLAPEYIRSAVLRMTEAVTDLAGEVMRRECRSGLSHPILEKLSRSIVDRARRLAPNG
jgi:serine/threonine-protein kinase HipA